MTENVARWLEGWAGDEVKVVCEGSEVRSGCMGVYRKGVVCRQEYPDGAREETRRFLIEICFWAQNEADREGYLEKLHSLEDWIRRKDVEGELPEMNGECWRAELVEGFELKKSSLLEKVYGGVLDFYVTV